MKAAVLEKIHGPLEVRDIELTDLKVGQVLVRVIVSGICGSQIHEIMGHKGNEKFLPHLMGHEGCGIVEAVGAGVNTVKVGDKVVMHWRPGSGIESDFPQYILDGKTITSGKVTTLSEYSIVSENRLTTVPRDTPPFLAALLGCSLTTALGVIDNEADLKIGESVAILGCGGVGLNLLQGAYIKGAYPIIAVDKAFKRNVQPILDLANVHIDTSCDIIDFALTKAAPNGVDVIIDTTGSTYLLNEALKHLSNNGRLIMVGQPNPNLSLEITNPNRLFNGIGHKIKATQGGQTRPDIDIPRYINFFNSGRINVSDIVTNTFALDDINTAFNLLISGEAGRIMIRISEDVK